MNKNLFPNINEQNDKINEEKKKDDILDFYKKKIIKMKKKNQIE